MRVTNDPWQIVVEPPAVIEGGEGLEKTFTTTGEEDADAHPFPSI